MLRSRHSVDIQALYEERCISSGIASMEVSKPYAIFDGEGLVTMSI